MKRRTKIFFSLLFIILVVFICYQFQNFKKIYTFSNEILMIVDNAVKPYIAKDQNENNLKTITDISNNLEWVEKSEISKFSTSDREPDYKFWNKSRKINYDVWFNNGNTIIYNRNTGKYAYINNDDSITLEILLDELTPSKSDLLNQNNS